MVRRESKITAPAELAAISAMTTARASARMPEEVVGGEQHALEPGDLIGMSPLAPVARVVLPVEHAERGRTCHWRQLAARWGRVPARRTDRPGRRGPSQKFGVGVV